MLRIKYPNWNFNFNLYEDRDKESSLLNLT